MSGLLSEPKVHTGSEAVNGSCVDYSCWSFITVSSFRLWVHTYINVTNTTNVILTVYDQFKGVCEVGGRVSPPFLN